MDLTRFLAPDFPYRNLRGFLLPVRQALDLLGGYLRWVKPSGRHRLRKARLEGIALHPGAKANPFHLPPGPRWIVGKIDSSKMIVGYALAAVRLLVETNAGLTARI